MLKNKFPLKLDIQFFAEQDPPADPPQDPPADPPNDPPADPPAKTFTEEEVEKMIKDRVAREQKAKEKAIEEAAKLAKMNADEKKDYEFKKLQEELAELRKKDARHGLAKEASNMLVEADITPDDETLDFVVREDAETTKVAVQSFVALVTKKVDAAVKEKLKGTPPKKSAGNTGTMTKAEIMAIADDFDRRKKIAENPHLFKK